MKKTLNSLSESEYVLVRETKKSQMAGLDEDGLIDLHSRIRRARNKHVTLYRRAGAEKVKTKGGRGSAKAANARNAAESRGLRGRLEPREPSTGQGFSRRRSRIEGRATGPGAYRQPDISKGHRQGQRQGQGQGQSGVVGTNPDRRHPRITRSKEVRGLDHRRRCATSDQERPEARILTGGPTSPLTASPEALPTCR